MRFYCMQTEVKLNLIFKWDIDLNWANLECYITDECEETFSVVLCVIIGTVVILSFRWTHRWEGEI